MSKKILKTVIISILFLALIVPNTIFAASTLSRVAGYYNFIVKSQGNADFNGNVLSFQYSNAYNGYKTAKQILKEDSSFQDLILDGYFPFEIYNCGTAEPNYKIETQSVGEYQFKGITVENAENSDSGKMAVYYDAVKDSGYIRLTEGRWIDSSAPTADKPLEILINNNLDFNLDSIVWVDLGFDDVQGNPIFIKAKVVGKVETPFYKIPQASNTYSFGFSLFDNEANSDKTNNFCYIQNPLDSYGFDNLYQRTDKENLNKYQAVNFKIARKNESCQNLISEELTEKVLNESGASLIVNYGKKDGINSVSYSNDIKQLLILSALLAVSTAVIIAVYIKALIKVWKRNKYVKA